MSQANALEQLMLELVNEERAAVGAPPLRFNGDLNEASEDHSEWMLATDTFSHTGQGGSSAGDRIQQAGYQLEGNWTWGENIAWQSERGDPGLEDDVRDLHESLMNSPGHRANILNPDFEEIGIGIERGDFDRFDSVMVTQNFGATDSTSNPISPPAPQPPQEPPVAQPQEPPITQPPQPPVTQPPVMVDQPAPPPVMPPLIPMEQPGAPVDQPWTAGPSEGPRLPDFLIELLQDVFEFTPPPVPLLTWLDNSPGLDLPGLTPEPPIPAPTPVPVEGPLMLDLGGLDLTQGCFDGMDTWA